MFQKIIIAGRLTRDAEQKSFNGQAGESLLTKFSVAVDDGFGDKKTTDFFNVSAWNGVGKGVAPYLTKGTQVLVEGKMKQSKNGEQTFWDLRADKIQLIGGRSEGGNNNGQSNRGYGNNGGYNNGGYNNDFDSQFSGVEISSDDIPF